MFDPRRLLQGENGLIEQAEWVALVPPQSVEVHLTSMEMAAAEAIGRDVWKPMDEVARAVGEDQVHSLLAKGVLVQQGTSQGVRDELMRGSNWHPLAALSHALSRWSHTDSAAALREARLHSVEDMIAASGPPPPHYHHRADALSRAALPRPNSNDLDVLMARRATCRNFDVAEQLALADLGALMHRAFGVQASEELAPGAVALKKNHPSGGGLHPLEAYLIVQRVAGLLPGVYHYNSETHAVDLLRETPLEAARALALTAVAGQEYFADAPVMVVIAARFARSFWKYRNHPKIYRAILLETGHASQNLYLAATELGLGAFVTAAINEVEIEQAFDLDPMQEGVLAVCGFGARLPHKTTVELDPRHAVWDEDGRLR